MCKTLNLNKYLCFLTLIGVDWIGKLLIELDWIFIYYWIVSDPKIKNPIDIALDWIC